MATSYDDYAGLASIALSEYLAQKSKEKEDQRRYDYLGNNTEAGFWAGTRAEDKDSIELGANLAQQNPYTTFDQTQRQNLLTDISRGETVGPQWAGSTAVPGTRFSAPTLGIQYGSQFKAAQTPRNIASELANHQSRIVRADPNSSVTPVGDLVPGAGGDLAQNVELSRIMAKHRQDAARREQLSAIQRAKTGESSGSDYDTAMAAAGIATAGGKNSALSQALKMMGGGTGEESAAPAESTKYEGFASPESLYNANPTAKSSLMYPEGFSADTPNYDPYQDPMNYTATGVYIGPDPYSGSTGGTPYTPPVDPWAKYDAANPGWGTNGGYPIVTNTGDYKTDPGAPTGQMAGTWTGTVAGPPVPYAGDLDPTINYGSRRDDPNFQGGGQNWSPGSSTGGGGGQWYYDFASGKWMYREGAR